MNEASGQKIRVVFIAGAGRSGTTLIADALGSVAGAGSWGELRYVWERGILQNRWCGCGRPVNDCPQWSAVFATAGLATEELPRHARSVVTSMEPLLRTRSAWHALAKPTDRPTELLEQLARLYRALADTSGVDVIVDSSKLPAYAWLLAGIDDIDLRIVSVVRDPRAVAYSWSRHKDLPDDVSGTGAMARLSPARAAAVWLSQNALADALMRRIGAPRLHLRYEEFTDDPAGTLGRLAEFAGLPTDDLPVDGDHLTIAEHHTVAGNPDRFSRGRRTQVITDDRWVTDMGARDRHLVTAATAPLLPKYGYGWRR